MPLLVLQMRKVIALPEVIGVHIYLFLSVIVGLDASIIHFIFREVIIEL